MNQRDLRTVADTIAPIIQKFAAEAVDRATAPLVTRIAELEAREPIKGDSGKDGRDGIDGKDIDQLAVAALITTEVEKAVSAIPKPQDGKDGAPGKDGRDGIDGKDVDHEHLAAMVAAEVTASVALIPKPQDGKDGAPGKDGRDGIDGKDAVPGERGLKGEPGQDGAPGRDGRDGLPGVPGQPGKDGAPGQDGISFEAVEPFEDEHEFGVRFIVGDGIKEMRWSKPTLADFDCGIWKEGQYRRGSVVTFGGSAFIARKDTDKKPETDDWRLIVKRGRDGKDGRIIAPALPEPVRLK